LEGFTSSRTRSNFAIAAGASVFSFRDRKLAVIILGSENRAEEVENVLSWVENAYAF